MNMKDILLSVFKDKYNKIVFSSFNGEVYLVGGFIRDLLIGRKSIDRDFVIKGDINKVADKIKRLIGGTKVFLKDTVRIALKDGTTIDLNYFSHSIEDDLARRDFTFNAISISKTGELIDIYKGIDDLYKRNIRMISDKNLISDPLRMLRAYRFVSELNGSIEENTRSFIIKHKDNLKYIATERITLEFFKLLNAKHVEKALKMALMDRVLNVIFSFNKYFNLELIINKIYKICKKLKESHEIFTDIYLIQDAKCQQKLSLLGLIFLEILIESAEDKILLNFSKKLKKRLNEFLQGQKSECLKKLPQNADKKDIFDCFKHYGSAVLEATIINDRFDLLKMVKRYYLCKKYPFIKGKDIIDAGIKKGPIIGEILNLFIKAQFEGKIKDREDALRCLYKFLEKNRLRF